MSVRKFFDDIQLAQESGGRQHDKSGQPLVGRYRDGTTPAPDKRAYGAGQMQIGTAKAVAEKHGIKWDQNKFLNDKEYNLTLADTHMSDLTAKYGDKRIAKGAYHSGEGTVDKAIAKYGRENFAQGLGPEGRSYVGMKTYNSSSPGHGVADPAQFLAGLESTLAPQTAASGNVSSNAGAIFGSDGELNKRGQAVETQLGEQMNAIDFLDQTTNALQVTQQAAMKTQLDETRAVSDEITRGTQELAAQVKPVIEARTRVANQLDQLNTMNPLERGLRGIFDLNYDRKYLESQLDHFDKTMDARAHDYDYLNKLHNVALQEVDRRFKMDTAMPGLMVDQAKEDLGIVGLRLQQTASSLGNLTDMVKSQSQIISAKAVAREDMLGRLDAPTLANLAAQAKANNGVVEHGGVQLSYNEVYERQQAKEAQDLNIESVRMSIASHRMDMAEKYSVNLARSLTREQAESAIAKGGVYEGIQLPQDVLTNVYQEHLKRAEMQAATIANTMPAGVALKAGIDALRTTTGIYERTRGMYGSGDQPAAAAIMNAGTLAIRALTEATKTGQPPEVIAALTQKVAQTTKQMQEHTDGVILRQVGGDKRAAGYMQGYVYGTPLSQGTAIEAMTYFALKGNLPTGMQVSPEAKQIFQKTQLEVERLRKQGKDPATGKPWTEAGLARAVATNIGAVAADTVGAARFNELYRDLPAIAKSTNHPLGRMKQADWQKAVWDSQNAAAQAVASKTGIPLEQVVQMNDKNAPLNDTPEANSTWKKFEAASGLWNTVEQNTLVNRLDELPQVTPGRRNSSVLTDFISSSRMSRFTNQYNGARGANSMGDYLVNPISAGSTEAKIAEFGKNFHAAQTDEYQTRQRLARNFPAGRLTNPMDRTMLILSSMPGVSTAGARKLAPVIQEIVKPFMTNGHDKSQNLQFMMQEQDAAVLEGLKSRKFQDPSMETLRKNAISSWGQHATQTKGFIESLLNAAQAGL